jgi:hypothetical protein
LHDPRRRHGDGVAAAYDDRVSFSQSLTGLFEEERVSARPFVELRGEVGRDTLRAEHGTHDLARRIQRQRSEMDERPMLAGRPADPRLRTTGDDDQQWMSRSDLRQLLQRRARCVIRPVPILQQQDCRPLPRVERHERGDCLQHRRLELLSLEVRWKWKLGAPNRQQSEVEREKLTE